MNSHERSLNVAQNDLINDALRRLKTNDADIWCCIGRHRSCTDDPRYHTNRYRVNNASDRSNGICTVTHAFKDFPQLRSAASLDDTSHCNASVEQCDENNEMDSSAIIKSFFGELSDMLTFLLHNMQTFNYFIMNLNFLLFLTSSVWILWLQE